MKDVNKVILIGRCGKEPLIRESKNGSKLAYFGMATGESWKDKNGEWQEKTQWHNVSVFGKPVDYIEKNIHKGSRLYIEGNVVYETYTDKAGVEKSVTKIKAWSVISLDAKAGVKQAPPADDYSGTITSDSAPPQEEDDLPF